MAHVLNTDKRNFYFYEQIITVHNGHESSFQRCTTIQRYTCINVDNSLHMKGFCRTPIYKSNCVIIEATSGKKNETSTRPKYYVTSNVSSTSKQTISISLCMLLQE